ncbi:hypothetical protein EXN66_Car013723 [Channa argus]|uniref:Immunoglobulin V-set domain-containing protein n=1 Tax=Channa argus TaxID=215402 RepID=A0A6G1Q6A3_CHAAH|nr:hypothetical protein EXN66_Car013723 [Channa argus]KAK2899673.1 hypothetical protein Q8A73_012802 [Channa argus]
MICRILPLVSLTFCVVFSLKVTTRLQGCSTTISVEIGKPTNMTHINLDCVFLSNVKKVLFCFSNGQELENLYHPQFIGRVRSKIDKEEIVITLAQFNTDDEGNYMCIYRNTEDNTSANESFVLKRPSKNMCVSAAEPRPAPEDPKQPTGAVKENHPSGGFGVAAAVLVLVVVIVAVVVWHKARTAARLRDLQLNGGVSSSER